MTNQAVPVPPDVTDTEYDFVIVGSGSGALTAAVTAADAGQSVLVVEKSGVVGGTSALSGGVAWIPGNPLMRNSGKPDSRAEAERYLANVIGDRLRPDVVAAYLDNGPGMVDFLQARTELQFHTIAFPDYKPDLGGAVTTGRSIGAIPYDARRLGPALPLLRRPLAFTTVFGGMALDFIDIYHMLNALMSTKSLAHATRLVSRYGRDLLTHGRDMRLTLGNALIGRLLRSALDMQVDLWTDAPAVDLTVSSRSVTGVRVIKDGRQLRISARRGVLLASGGFANDASLRNRYLPYPDHMRTMSVDECTGDALRMGIEAGGAVETDLFQNFLGFPISVLQRRDGTNQNYMHIGSVGRSKPGTICVDGGGRRFVNEAAPYNDFVHAMIEANAVPAYWICDRRHFRSYGFGLIAPPVWMHRLKPYLESGYLVQAPTLGELACKLGLPEQNLESTVARFNEHARRGIDPEFGKGNNLYDRSGGDPGSHPNPGLGPLEQGPFYAIRCEPGNLGTYVGLQTDGSARVVGSDGSPIAGLYACGLDASSIFSGNYPGGGSSIGPSMVFGFIAARHASLGKHTATAPAVEAITTL